MRFFFGNADYRRGHTYTKQNFKKHLEIILLFASYVPCFVELQEKNAYLSMNYIQQLLEISNITCAKSDFSYEHDTPGVAVEYLLVNQVLHCRSADEILSKDPVSI